MGYHTNVSVVCYFNDVYVSSIIILKNENILRQNTLTDSMVNTHINDQLMIWHGRCINKLDTLVPVSVYIAFYLLVERSKHTCIRTQVNYYFEMCIFKPISW